MSTDPVAALKILAIPLFLAIACGSNATEAPSEPKPSGQAGSGQAGQSAGPIEQATCPTQPVPRAPLRRLTRFEYQNSVSALLHVDTSSAAELPADELTNSFDNNAAVLTVSALHAEKYVLVSEALAKLAASDVTKLTGCDEAKTGAEACARAFAKSFGRRAFRRPITTEDEQSLMTAYAAGHDGGSHAEGIEVMIRAGLQSPYFLYRLETTSPGDARTQVPVSPFELATRLSFMFWGSGPDDALLDAAERGELASKAQVATQARAMLAQPQARLAIANFFEQWTGTRRLDITTKSATTFPAFSAPLRDKMADELPAFVEHVLWSGDRSLKSLLTEPVAFVDAALAKVYGVAAPAGSGLVQLPPEQGRSGFLTQAGFLSVQSHPDQTSPVLRGKFVRAMLLCQPPQPPPPDVDVSLPSVDEGATARVRLAAHLVAGNSCSGCHALMDPIGLAFENFDAMGQYRELEAGAPIDVSGELIGATDEKLSGSFRGVRELALKLAESEQVRECVATQWFRFAAGRSEGDADRCSLGTLRAALDSSDGDVLELLVATTQTDAFWFRSPLTP